MAQPSGRGTRPGKVGQARKICCEFEFGVVQELNGNSISIQVTILPGNQKSRPKVTRDAIVAAEGG